MAYAFVVLTIVFTVLGQYFQKLAADELLVDFTPTRALDYLGLMLDRHMLGAMASLGLAMLCWLLALQWLDVSKAYPLLADYFSRYDPYKVKRYERVWMSSQDAIFVVDHRPIEFTPEEQTLVNSYGFMDLGRFQFLVRTPQREGDLRGMLRRMSIARLDPGLYPMRG